MTRNEVRILENLNPLPGLDVPLAQMNMTPVTSAQLQDQQSQILLGVVERIAYKESKAIGKAIERYIRDVESLKEWAQDFFTNHASFVSKGLAIDQATAEGYARRRLIQFLSPIEEGSVVDVNQWGKDSIEELMTLNETN